MWGDITSDSNDDIGEYIEDINDSIVLTVGYVPGLRVEAMRPMPKATLLLRRLRVHLCGARRFYRLRSIPFQAQGSR